MNLEQRSRRKAHLADFYRGQSKAALEVFAEISRRHFEELTARAELSKDDFDIACAELKRRES
jgi:hypothetical protein